MRISDFEDDGTYQVDLILTLFAVLLVLLLVFVTELARSGSQYTGLEYRTQEGADRPFMLSSLDVTYRAKRLWILKGGRAGEIDLPSLARLYANAAGPRFQEIVDDTAITIEPDDEGSLDGFFVQLVFPREVRQSKVIRRVVEIDSSTFIPTLLEGDPASPTLVYVWPEEIARAAALEAAFRGERRALELFFLTSGSTAFTLRRMRTLFEFEHVLRTY